MFVFWVLLFSIVFWLIHHFIKPIIKYFLGLYEVV